MTLVLRGERLEISPIARRDIPEFVAYRAVDTVARYQSWSPDYSAADAEALVASQPMSGTPRAGEWVQLGLRLLETSSLRMLVGDVAVGADAVQPDTYELGVTIAPEHQRRGYASEGLRVVLDWLMVTRGAHRVVMHADARNTAILELARGLGLRHEGAAVAGDFFKGEWTTLERFAILRREWPRPPEGAAGPVVGSD